MPLPVLGCGAWPELRAHARLPCLGVLTTEELAALAVLLPQGLRLNTLLCGSCSRTGVERALADRVTRISLLHPGGELRCARTTEELAFRDRVVDRRGFFRSLRGATARKAARVFSGTTTADAGGRGAKYLPRPRRALETALARAAAPAADRLSDAFTFHLTIAADCTACPRCAAMCPTGALGRVGERTDRRLAFDPRRCTGCGVCVSFCPSGSLRLRRVADGQERSPALGEGVPAAQPAGPEGPRTSPTATEAP
ncbi:MAG: 4Fe-4S dicluster domain-containing protein [Deferrisomatales bacterium]